MNDPFGRPIDYLRVSVTDRCNLRCWYCAPTRNWNLLRHEELLSFDEITQVVRAAAALGFRKIRITGGEPLLRPGLPDLVQRIAVTPGIADLGLTSNGVLLAEMARPLREAGLHRVNVSLDAVEPARFAAITGGGDLAPVLAGIEAALAADLRPVKLNCVVERDPDEADARAVAAWAAAHGCEARFIPQMDMERGVFSKVFGGAGGDCPACNRLRLSSAGLLLPCLFSEPAFSVRELGAEEALRRAIDAKPEIGGRCSRNWMHGIGG
jgi:cyclic pyranopterin phosphate synthase